MALVSFMLSGKSLNSNEGLIEKERVAAITNAAVFKRKDGIL